jgi:hypothetical protein
MVLQGQYVGLRAIEPEDLPTLLHWRNKPEFRRYFREYRELSSNQQQAWFEKFVIADKSTLMFAICALESGELLGACGLCYIDWVNRNADFSIYIGHDDLYIDTRFTLDAARVMIRYAFDELQLHRLWAEVYDFDQAKKSFFIQMGFQQEGCFRDTCWTEGAWHNSVFYSLLQTDTL